MEDHGAPESDSQVDWQVGGELELVHSETRQEWSVTFIVAKQNP